MDLSTLNRLIVDHLRYYGYQIAARIVETEVKANKVRIVDGPSKLFDMFIKSSKGLGISLYHDGNSTISGYSKDASTNSGSKRRLYKEDDENSMITAENIRKRVLIETSETNEHSYYEDKDAKTHDNPSLTKTKHNNSMKIYGYGHYTGGETEIRKDTAHSTQQRPHPGISHSKPNDSLQNFYNQPAKVRLKDVPRLKSSEINQENRAVSVQHHLPNQHQHQYQHQQQHLTLNSSETNTSNQLYYQDINRRQVSHQDVSRDLLNSSFSEEFRRVNRTHDPKSIPHNSNRRNSSQHSNNRIHQLGNDNFLPVSYSEYRSKMVYQPNANNYEMSNNKPLVKHEMIANNFWPTGPELAQKASKEHLLTKNALLRTDSPILKLPTRNQSDENFLQSNPNQPQIFRSETEYSDNSMNHSAYFNKKKLPNSEELIDGYNTQVELSHKTMDFLKYYTRLSEREIREGFHVYVQVLNPRENPELLMNREKFNEYIQKMRGIQFLAFNDACFNFAVAVLKNDRESKEITYREVGQLLDFLHPEHPFSLMKFLFKLYQEGDKSTHLSSLYVPLQEISTGKLHKIAQLLRGSLQYIREQQHVRNVITIP